MPHEFEIGAVISDVTEHDEARVQRKAGDEGDLGGANGEHRTLFGVRAYFANSFIASSASTPPVIEMGAKAAFAAISRLEIMI